MIEATGLERPKIIRAVPNSARRMLKTRWCWFPFAPLGEVTLVTGTTDLGKSTLCLDLAGALTRGKLEGEFYQQPVNVAYVALEDTIETDIAPKLVATDCDRDRFFDIVAPEGGWINLPGDLEQMIDLINQTSAKVLFLDPITSVVSGDKSKQHEVRPVMEVLRAAAAKKGIAVFGVIHQRKGNTGTATEGVIGSAEWVNVARSVIAVKEHKEQPGTFILSIGKGNRAPRDQRRNLLYTFDQRPIDVYLSNDSDETETQLTPKIKWIGESDISVDDLMEASNNGGASELEATIAWLEALLIDQGGELDRAEVLKQSRSNGINSDVLTTAGRKLSVQHVQNGSTMVWRLP